MVISIAFDGVLAFVPLATFRPPSCKCDVFEFRKGPRSSHVDNSRRCPVACLTFLAATSVYWLPPNIADWLVAAAGVDYCYQYWYSSFSFSNYCRSFRLVLHCHRVPRHLVPKAHAGYNWQTQPVWNTRLSCLSSVTLDSSS